MLKQIRGTMKSVVAIVFILPLIVAFAAWGVPEVRQFTSNHAVRVGDEGFSALAVQKEFDRFLTSRRLSGDESFDRAAAIAAGLPRQIVESLATRSALDQEARRMGLTMPREMVKDYLQTNEQFKNPRTGKFDSEALTGVLREYNYDVAEFEDRLQSDLLRNQLMSAVGEGAVAPKALIDPLVLRETENRTIAYLTVSDEMAGASAPATPDALKAYYEKNPSQFMAPEYRTFTAVIMKNSDYVDAEQTTEEELRKAYEAKKASYETPERRTLYQLRYDDGAKAKAAADALKAGKPFEQLAIENGQTLADVTLENAAERDILDPKVAEAVFAADQGAVVGPIEGVFGFTLAQVASVTPASIRPFEEARAELEEEFSASASKKNLFEAIDEIENARDTGASLADAAAKADARAAEFGPVDSYSFGPGGEIIVGVPGDVLKHAFELEEGEESEAVELADKSGYFFVSVSEVRPPAVIAFEKVAGEVEAKWRENEKSARIDAAVKSLRAAIEGGKTLKEAAEALNRAPLVETVTRRSANELLSEPLIEQIFSAAKGDVISGPNAAGDAEVVIVVNDVAYDSGKVSPDDIAVFSRYVGGQLSQELIDAYANAVRDDAGVKIAEDQIDAIFGEAQ